MLGCGKDKVIKLKRELKKYDLLEEVRQELNKPNLIYLGTLQAKKASNPLVTAEFGKSESNDTDISDTNYSDYISSRKTERFMPRKLQ